MLEIADESEESLVERKSSEKAFGRTKLRCLVHAGNILDGILAGDYVVCSMAIIIFHGGMH